MEPPIAAENLADTDGADEGRKNHRDEHQRGEQLFSGELESIGDEGEGKRDQKRRCRGCERDEEGVAQTVDVDVVTKDFADECERDAISFEERAADGLSDRPDEESAEKGEGERVDNGEDRLRHFGVASEKQRGRRVSVDAIVDRQMRAKARFRHLIALRAGAPNVRWPAVQTLSIMKKLPSFLIVADRGRLIAYTCESRRQRGTVPRMVAEVTFSEGHERLSQQVTDQAGSFPAAGTAGRGNAAAERMSLIEEMDTQNFRRVGNCINHVLSSHHPEDWGFAAPSEINR